MGTWIEAVVEGSWSQFGKAELVKTGIQNRKYVVERVKLQLGELQVVAGLWAMSFLVKVARHWLQRV